jgi:hypothetical protein
VLLLSAVCYVAFPRTLGGQGADTIFHSGTIHAGGSAIDAGKGDDSVTVVISSEVTGRINRENRIHTLTFQLSGDQATLLYF